MNSAVSRVGRRAVSSFAAPPHRARVLVVGSGRMGHIRSSLLFANPRFELAGIVDVNYNGARELAETYRVSEIRLEPTHHVTPACQNSQTFYSLNSVNRRLRTSLWKQLSTRMSQSMASWCPLLHLLTIK